MSKDHISWSFCNKAGKFKLHHYPVLPNIAGVSDSVSAIFGNAVQSRDFWHFGSISAILAIMAIMAISAIRGIKI